MKYLVLGAVLLAGCVESAGGPGVEAETHWMRVCDDDADCGELSCICGVCTELCGVSDCAQSGGECAPDDWSRTYCGEGAICAAACASDDACQALDPDLVCHDGYCAPAAVHDGGSPDAARPDGRLPDAAMPDAVMPDAVMPDAVMPDAVTPDVAMPDAAMPDMGDACDGVECGECYVCEAGECVVDRAELMRDEPICGSECMDWPNPCAAITVAHQPLRPGPCFDADTQALCEATQGQWTLGACEPSRCGADPGNCADQCLFACDCGPSSVWDAERGCVGDPACDGDLCAGAACAGAWRAPDGCRDPSGLPLSEACCVPLECGALGTYRDPDDGACVEAELGCGVPFHAPPCALVDPPCDVGVFLRFGRRERGAACYGGPAFNLNLLWVAADIVPLQGPVNLSYVDRCPDGQVRLSGMPDGYDYYGTCADGICETTGMEQMRDVATRWNAGRAFGRDAQDCNAPLDPGVYTLGGEFIETSDKVVCDFTWLELRVLADE